MLTRADLIKIGKGALIAGGAAALTYAFQAFDAIDFGPHEPLVTAVLAILINLIRKIKL